MNKKINKINMSNKKYKIRIGFYNNKINNIINKKNRYNNNKIYIRKYRFKISIYLINLNKKDKIIMK